MHTHKQYNTRKIKKQTISKLKDKLGKIFMVQGLLPGLEDGADGEVTTATDSLVSLLYLLFVSAARHLELDNIPDISRHWAIRCTSKIHLRERESSTSPNGNLNLTLSTH